MHEHQTKHDRQVPHSSFHSSKSSITMAAEAIQAYNEVERKKKQNASKIIFNQPLQYQDNQPFHEH